MEKPSIQEVRVRLETARNTPELKRKFPEELWKDIFILIEGSSINRVAQELGLSVNFLERKIRNQKKKAIPLSFKEVSFSSCSSIVIELNRKNLIAQITAPLADCTSILTALFKEE